jgi:hypothetical protein
MITWKDFASLVQSVLTLSRELEQNRTDVKDLRRDLQALIIRVEQLANDGKMSNAELANEIKMKGAELANELKLVSERESGARDQLSLKLQIALLQFDRQQQVAKGDSDERSSLILSEGTVSESDKK